MSRSSSPAKMMAKAKAPSRRFRTSRDGLDAGLARAASRADEMGDDLGIGLRGEDDALRATSSSFSSRKFSMMPLCTMTTSPRHVRMGVGLVRRAMRRPARMADAGRALGSGARSSFASRLPQLACGAAALELAILERGDAGRIVAAIFEPLQRIDQLRGDRRSCRECRRCRTCLKSSQIAASALYLSKFNQVCGI